ncbi:acyl carrier protein [Candidatus Uhrbacteria bacterium]|nr:acyl carrier protein [Candidatus Uhrbacteria bacterium]
MERQDVLTKVVRIVSEQLNVRPEKINEATHFVNDLGADSLDTVELVMEFEDGFDIEIPDNPDGQQITTVGRAVDYIMWVQGGKQSPNPLDTVAVAPGTGALGSPPMFKEGVGL